MFKGFKFGKSGKKEEQDTENIENLVQDNSINEAVNTTPLPISEDADHSEKGDSIDEKEEKKEENINIFDDFSLDEDLKNDVDEFNKEASRDAFDYLSIISGSLTYLNLVIFLVILTVFSYIFVQKKPDLSDVSWLDPVCNLILGDVPTGDYSYCSTITHMEGLYKNKLEALKNNQYEVIAKIIPDVYKKYDYINSREMVFLLDKKENRLRPSEIIEAFHKLKNEFSPIDKEVLICSRIIVDSGNTLSIDCEARSSSWDSGIKGYLGSLGPKVGGTSISVASSFVNFIELESDNFSVITPPKQLSSREMNLTESGYNRVTNFSIKLQYNSDNIGL